MENSKSIAQDQLQLKAKLDRSNPRPNMKTELQLSFIKSSEDEWQLIAHTLFYRSSSFLVLCRLGDQNKWETVGSTGLEDLKRFCADWLNANIRPINPNFWGSLAGIQISNELQQELNKLLLLRN